MPLLLYFANIIFASFLSTLCVTFASRRQNEELEKTTFKFRGEAQSAVKDSDTTGNDDFPVGEDLFDVFLKNTQENLYYYVGYGKTHRKITFFAIHKKIT